MRMGGSSEDIDVRLAISGMTHDGQMQSRQSIEQQLLRFDAGKAVCTVEVDRARLLAVIEAAFGTAAPFNNLVRGVLAEKLRDEPRLELV